MKDHIYRRYLLRKPRKLKPMPQPPEGCMFSPWPSRDIIPISLVESVVKDGYNGYDGYDNLTPEERKERRLKRMPVLPNDV